MGDSVYVILFGDGSLQVSRIKPEKGHYQQGARFFRATTEEMTLRQLSNWVSHNYAAEHFPGTELK